MLNTHEVLLKLNIDHTLNFFECYSKIGLNYTNPMQVYF